MERVVILTEDGIMTEQVDLFDRAAKCERLMDVALDPDQKEAFKQFRDMWIAGK